MLVFDDLLERLSPDLHHKLGKQDEMRSKYIECMYAYVIKKGKILTTKHNMPPILTLDPMPGNDHQKMVRWYEETLPRWIHNADAELTKKLTSVVSTIYQRHLERAFELEFTAFVSTNEQQFTDFVSMNEHELATVRWNLGSLCWALRGLKKGYGAWLASIAAANATPTYPKRRVDHGRKRAVSSVNHKRKRAERGTDHNRKRVRPARFPQRRRDDEDVSSSEIPFLPREGMLKRP